MKLQALCIVIFSFLFLTLPAAAQEGRKKEIRVNLFYPPEKIVLEESYVVVEGTVVDPQVYDMEIVVKSDESEETYRTFARDFMFAEEVDLEPGLNRISVGSARAMVFSAVDGEKPPADYVGAYGHHGLDDSCAECHMIDDTGLFTFEGEPGESCGWCHGDLQRGTGGDELNSVHRPVKDGQCLLCHTPHLSDKPGLLVEEPPECSECHAEVYEGIEKDRYVHGPLNLGDCRLCHATHSSKETALLKRNPTVLCTECHSEIKPRENTPEELMPHTMIPEGRCGRCHFPHSSENPRMMRQPSSRLCYDCHPKKTRSFHEKKGFSIYVCQKCHDLHRPTIPHLIIDNSRSLCMECHEFKEDAAFTHEFIREGGCFICHTFHEAPLSDDIAVICLRCHGENPRLDSAHQGLDIRKTSCTICHRPHQSDREKLLFPVEHTPFARRDCDSCHGERAALLDGPLRDLCLDCHDEKKLPAADDGKMKVHPPVEEEDCSFCHRSHASTEHGLLKEKQINLCLGCHRKLKKVTVMKPKSSHSAVLNGACHQCHELHFSPNPSMLKEPVTELCFTCHEELTKGPGGTGWAAPHEPVAKGKCRQCHRTHTSRKESLLKTEVPKVCRPCHQEFFQKFRSTPKTKRHKPAREGDCSACHDVHGSAVKSLLGFAVIENLCLTCHDAPGSAHHRFTAEDLQEKTGMAEFQGGICLTCHRPHSSTNNDLLKGSASKVCRSCHTL